VRDNLGIGTPTPSTPLEVNGTIQSSDGGFMFPDGTVQTTAVAGGRNTLDEAYDQGGAGAGRTITADAGAFQVAGNDGALFGGTFSLGGIPAENAGTRMMWYPGKAAFRAGMAGAAQWNDTNVGDYSVAMGNSTTASGTRSTAFGMNTTASGSQSTSMGSNTAAEAINSTAMGSSTTASGFASTAMGSNTIASGTNSTAMGSGTTSDGNSSTAIGYNSTVSGDYSMAFGKDVSTAADGTFIFGDNSATVNLARDIDNCFFARFAGGYYFYTNNMGNVGAFLGVGANSWDTISDSTKKENLQPVDGEEVLKKISRFNLSTWNYKGQNPAEFRHYGPMAQDFHAAFGHDGVGAIGNDTTLSSSDFAGINFIAIQALEKRTTELKAKTAEIEKLRNELVTLKEQNSELKQKLVSMESGFKKIETFMVKYQNQDKDADRNISLTNLK